MGIEASRQHEDGINQTARSLCLLLPHTKPHAAVLEEREVEGRTPLIWAIREVKPAIALWLIEHRGQHDLDSSDIYGRTALHWASMRGLLSVVQALVGADAKPAALDGHGGTSLLRAAAYNHPDIAAAILKPFVSEANHWMVQHHGIFQGYYFFHHVGLDRNLRDQFAGHPHYTRTEEFCALYDNPAFDPQGETEPIGTFEPMVRRVFEQPKNSLYKSASVLKPAA